MLSIMLWKWVPMFLLLTLSRASARTIFGEVFPQWPPYCCQLNLSSVPQGQLLPDDAVIGGIVDGKRWGYAVDRDQQNPGILAMSERYDEDPVQLRPEVQCEAVAPRSEFEVLTNPNKCSIGWYTTRYENEKFINPAGVSMNGKKIFLPAYKGFFFATHNDTYHEYLMPAAFNNGETSACYNSTGADVPHLRYRGIAAGTHVMYVDCFESLVTMSKVKLVNVTIDNNDLQATRDTNVVYLKRKFINRSNETQKQDVSFSAEKTNTIFVSVSESYSSTDCVTQKSSFSEHFRADFSENKVLVQLPDIQTRDRRKLSISKDV